MKENEDLLKIRKSRDFSKITTEQALEMINEKLTAGYHGVKHLFSSNDLKKTGLLTKLEYSIESLNIHGLIIKYLIIYCREAFRCVLNQLCGYLSNETWNKIVQRYFFHQS